MPPLVKITLFVGKRIGLFWGLEKDEMISRSTLALLSGVSQDSSGSSGQSCPPKAWRRDKNHWKASYPIGTCHYHRLGIAFYLARSLVAAAHLDDLKIFKPQAINLASPRGFHNFPSVFPHVCGMLGLLPMVYELSFPAFIILASVNYSFQPLISYLFPDEFPDTHCVRWGS
jgi:hypothetical protein